MVAAKRAAEGCLLVFVIALVVFFIVNPNLTGSKRSYSMATNQTLTYNIWTSNHGAAAAGRLATSTDIVTAAIKATVAVPKGTVTPIVSHPLNPGCVVRKLSKYDSLDTGLEYHHPSVIQYAKLTISPSTTEVQLTFTEYMALMSAHKFLKPDKIIIHTYTGITGKYWDLVNKWSTRIVLNKVEQVTRLGGRTVKQITHQADFIKVRGLYEFGGIISDFDVIIVNATALKDLQRKAECVLSLEADFVNAGFNSCIKNSSFVQEWLKGYYKDYRPDWLYNASHKPRNILQAANGRCYNMHVVGNIAYNPNWSHYKDWLKKDGVQWRMKIAAHYFNKGLKGSNETALQGDNSFGELLRYVYNAS